jgi:RNA polymerase sigma-70 factor (ECF subfamily)
VDHEHTEDFAEFYAAAWQDCQRAVRAVVGDRAHAEELTAEAFARAFAHWRKVRRHPAPRAWVVRVALNTHVSWWRKRRWEAASWRAEDPAHDYATTMGGAGGDLSGLLEDPVQSAVSALPRRQREVIALRALLDLDTKQTAEALKIAPRTVNHHYDRALTSLRAALGPKLNQEIVSS